MGPNSGERLGRYRWLNWLITFCYMFYFQSVGMGEHWGLGLNSLLFVWLQTHRKYCLCSYYIDLMLIHLEIPIPQLHKLYLIINSAFWLFNSTPSYQIHAYILLVIISLQYKTCFPDMSFRHWGVVHAVPNDGTG